MIKTVSLELSKQLKETGFPQETYLYWRLAGNLGWQLEVHYGLLKDKLIAAPTAEEIFERLPECIELNNTLWAITIEKYFDKWHFSTGHFCKVF